MDTSGEQVRTVVYRAVDEINEELPDVQQLIKDPKTVLFGPDATIDSMTLVSFIVAVEEGLRGEFGISLTLADEKAMSMERSPFRTLATFVDYVTVVVGAA
jgi:hypothetical protein